MLDMFARAPDREACHRVKQLCGELEAVCEENAYTVLEEEHIVSAPAVEAGLQTSVRRLLTTESVRRHLSALGSDGDWHLDSVYLRFMLKPWSGRPCCCPAFLVNVEEDATDVVLLVDPMMHIHLVQLTGGERLLLLGA